ncbi:MAG: apolipoprotein N-acyltransferase [Desulfuromonas sp.]|nr:apolipoprotein N-acyltransferase [Desulfuromonas sp.]
MIFQDKDSLFRLLAALASGLLFALAFPHAELAWLAWLALVPLFSVMQRQPWRSGFAAGVVFYAIVLYWLNNVMTTFGNLPLALSVVLYLLLAVYLAVYWGASCWCACRISCRLQLPLALVLPVVWVAFEYGRTYMLSGFPWGNIAYSQTPYPLLIQSADLAGVYVMVFLLILVNYVMAQLWQALRQHTVLPWRLVVVAAALFIANYAYGHWRMDAVASSRHKQGLDVALVQGNVEQSLKWQPQHVGATLDNYAQLSAKVSAADLLIWPESATPFFFQDGGYKAKRVLAVARENQSMLLFGSPAYQRQGEGAQRRYGYLNSAYLISAQGKTLGRSDKVHLVPFGEYVPLANLLSFVHRLAEGVGDFVAGSKSLLPVAGHEVGVLVCYEAIFPEIARDQVQRGAQLLVNITNDSWFGDSAAPWQHLAMTCWRAVENRVWIARCANSGVSAFIDPTGQVISQSHLFKRQTLSAKVYFADGTSLYTRTGDIVPLLFSLVVIAWLWQSRKRQVLPQ